MCTCMCTHVHMCTQVWVYVYKCVHLCVHVYVLRKVPKRYSEACSWIWSRCKVYEAGHWKRRFSRHTVLNRGHMLRTELPGERGCLSREDDLDVCFCSSPGRKSLPVFRCPPLWSCLHLRSFVVAGSGSAVKWAAWRPRFSQRVSWNSQSDLCQATLTSDELFNLS